MPAIYNEIESFAVEWLRNLERAGHVAPGRVDARSIADLCTADLDGVTQLHAFAGIGVWSHALRSAGWPDDREVWTGSCPCQPFSQAGGGKGVDDERHLWPEWFRLIRERRPAVVLGEQVSSTTALAWLDIVSTDLEGIGYEFFVVDFSASAVGAPHLRQRLYFAAVLPSAYGEAASRANSAAAISAVHAPGEGASHAGGSELHGDQRLAAARSGTFCTTADDGPVADDDDDGREVLRGDGLSDEREPPRRRDADGCGADGGSVGDAGLDRDQQHARELPGDGGPHDLGPENRDHPPVDPGAARGGGPANGFWADAVWIPCRDGKTRPTESGTFPLSHGTPGRVGLLRGYGNAIVAPQAALFVRCVMDVLG